ncbi:M20/M25/M40 family metallo-hydrolase [Siccirubricoccus deserti]
MGQPDGDGEDRRHRQGRQQPADPDRRGCRGPRPVPALGRGLRAGPQRRPARQHGIPAGGARPSRAPVAIGSHLDTQPTGGKFDGVLGVLAGLEIMRALHESGAETEAPLLLVNWTNEEGARFSPPMMGSGGAMGLFTEAEVLAKRAADGAVFGEELRRIGWQGEADPTELQKVGAYLELHIEQGKVLEDGGHDVGIVTHALGQSWFEVVVEGEEAHGGSVMAGRRDALMAAAPLISAVEEIALSTCSPTGRRGAVRSGWWRSTPAPATSRRAGSFPSTCATAIRTA